jgi:hypothetical protein
LSRDPVEVMLEVVFGNHSKLPYESEIDSDPRSREDTVLESSCQDSLPAVSVGDQRLERS